MKIGRPSRGSSAAKVYSGKQKAASKEGAAKPLEVEKNDVVCLSAESVADVQPPPVEAVQPSETATEGPLPDPRQTSEAIIKKELEIIFREVYL